MKRILTTLAALITLDGFATTPIEITLDADLAASDTARHIYNNTKEAFAAANGSEAAVITVRPGVYWLDDPDAEYTALPAEGRSVPFALEVECRNLTITGTDTDPEATVFAVNRGQTQGAIGNYTMLHFLGEELTVENLTFGNYCNADLDYARRPELSRKKRNNSIVQAQIGICELPGPGGPWGDYGSGTRTVMANNCRFISRLNLCPLIGARMSFYNGCYFECTDDALTGTAVYRDCTFTFFSSKPFYSTAPTGAVFINCDITMLTRGVQYLTKVPGMVTLIDTRFHTPGGNGDATIRWTRDPSATVCYQRGVTLDGKPYDVDADRPQLWQPLGQAQEAGTLLRLAPSDIRLKAQNDTAALSPELILWGGFESDARPEIVRWDFPDFVTLTPDLKIVSANRYPERMEGVVYATTADGLRGGVSVSVAPHLTPAPRFTSQPVITADKAGRKLTLAYTLDATADADDRSTVTWLRSERPGDITAAIPVARGPISKTRTYDITRADKGKYIVAIVEPQVYGTEKGEPVTASFDTKISTRHLGTLSADRTSYAPDLSLIPTANRRTTLPDTWSFDAYKPADTDKYDWVADNSRDAWYYGSGADGAAQSEGLVQAVRGARAFYRPDRTKCKAAALDLTLYPAKPAGQGFGSATGQYMDLYFMFDPETLSGYALRIERTPDHDKAVECTIVRLEQGAATPISDTAVTTAFRSPCYVSINAADGKIEASLRSDSPEAAGGDVKLSAPLAPGQHPAAIGFQHTGSVGGAATLINQLRASWK